LLNRILILMLTGIALAFAACGGDDEDSGPSKSEFIKQADSICADAEKQAEDIARQGFSDPENPKPQEVLDIIQDVIPVQRETLEKIRNLDKPEGDEDQIDEFLNEAEKATDEVAEISDPREAVTALQAEGTPDDPFYDANRAAEEYGLQTCAE
jgi:hypothetical protein